MPTLPRILPSPPVAGGPPATSPRAGDGRGDVGPDAYVGATIAQRKEAERLYGVGRFDEAAAQYRLSARTCEAAAAAPLPPQICAAFASQAEAMYARANQVDPAGAPALPRRPQAPPPVRFDSHFDVTTAPLPAFTAHTEKLREAAEARAACDPEAAKRLYREAAEIWAYVVGGPRWPNEAIVAAARAKEQGFRERLVAVDQPPPAAGPAPQAHGAEGGGIDEMMQRARALMCDSADPDVAWDDLVGCDRPKQALFSALVDARVLKKFYRKNRQQNGILLYGPGGTGKTLLVKAAANKVNDLLTADARAAAGGDDAAAPGSIKIFIVTLGDVMSKWVGEGEKFIKALFAVARAEAPSVIFFDEIDAMCRSRGGGSDASHNVLNQFLVEMNGFGSRGDVTVLAATNVPWLIDAAAMRRLKTRLYVGVPSAAGRAQILAQKLAELGADITAAQLAEISGDGGPLHNFSGDDVSNLAVDAWENGPMRRLKTATHFVVEDNKVVPCAPETHGAEASDYLSMSRRIGREGLDWADSPVTFADLKAAAELRRPANKPQDFANFERYERDGRVG